MKRFLTFIILVCFIPAAAQYVNPKPPPIPRTDLNKKVIDALAIWELEDADMICSEIKKATTLLNALKLVEKLEDHWDWFELYSSKSRCISKYSDLIFLYEPSAAISDLKTLKDLAKIKSNIEDIEGDIWMIWVSIFDCY